MERWAIRWSKKVKQRKCKRTQKIQMKLEWKITWKITVPLFQQSWNTHRHPYHSCSENPAISKKLWLFSKMERWKCKMDVDTLQHAAEGGTCCLERLQDPCPQRFWAPCLAKPSAPQHELSAVLLGTGTWTRDPQRALQPWGLSAPLIFCKLSLRVYHKRYLTPVN